MLIDLADSVRRDTFRQYIAEHWPSVNALVVEGDLAHFHAIEEAYFEKYAIARKSDACCVFCRSLLLVTEHGHHFCPRLRRALRLCQ